MTLAVRRSALEVFVRREFAAPREVVFAAWTDERLIAPLVGGAHLHHARLHDGRASGRRLEPPPAGARWRR